MKISEMLVWGGMAVIVAAVFILMVKLGSRRE
jgi:hypothetical protein